MHNRVQKARIDLTRDVADPAQAQVKILVIR